MNRLTGQFFQTLTCLLVVSTTWASSPKFTIVPETPGGNNLPVIKGSTAEVVYIVTNNLPSTKTLAMQPIANVTQKTQGANRCKDPFTLAHGASCELRLRVNTQNMTAGTAQVGGPQICITAGSTLSCGQPSQSNLLSVTVLAQANATLSFSSLIQQSSQDLTLATAEIFTARSGAGEAKSQPRTLTVTNLGPDTAYDVTIDYSLPNSTLLTTSPVDCSSLASGATCVLTITPGTTPTALAGSEPKPSVLTVHGSNTNSIKSDVIVLTYGNIYQEGYVYSIDDTTPTNESVLGSAAALLDQVVGKPYTPNWSAPADKIPGITDASTSPCLGNNDGACNTNQIVQYYTTHPGTYVATNCAKFTGGNYKDWYLPAECQMGYNPATDPDVGNCGSSTEPSIQNMASNLYNSNVGDLGTKFPSYWTSTEYSTDETKAWYIDFATGPSLSPAPKINGYASIRCSRELTKPLE